MHRHLKNNTPVHTEVLWGGGLWWGVMGRAAESTDHVRAGRLFRRCRQTADITSTVGNQSQRDDALSRSSVPTRASGKPKPSGPAMTAEHSQSSTMLDRPLVSAGIRKVSSSLDMLVASLRKPRHPQRSPLAMAHVSIPTVQLDQIGTAWIRQLSGSAMKCSIIVAMVSCQLRKTNEHSPTDLSP